MKKPESPDDRKLPLAKPRRLEPVDDPSIPKVTQERHTLVVHKHNYDWHRIIVALAFLILAVAAVLS